MNGAGCFPKKTQEILFFSTQDQPKAVMHRADSRDVIKMLFSGLEFENFGSKYSKSSACD